MLLAAITGATVVEITDYYAVLLKRVSEVRILFGTPVENTAILTSCGVFVFCRIKLHCRDLPCFALVGVAHTVALILYNS